MGKKIETMLEKLIVLDMRLASTRCYLSLDIGRVEHVERAGRRSE